MGLTNAIDVKKMEGARASGLLLHTPASSTPCSPSSASSGAPKAQEAWWNGAWPKSTRANRNFRDHSLK